MNAKLSGDEALLSSLYTDPSYLDFDYIRKSTEYIEEYLDYDYLFFPCPDSVTEFDYVVYASYGSKIINIKTPAYGADEFLITLDKNNYPLSFRGVISTESDTFRTETRKTEEFQIFYDTKADQPLIDGMLNDPNLKEFIDRLIQEDTNSETNE